ncbi:DUF3857 domain-containing protein [Fibrella aquatilis]|uniref:DUF3857 domain-containing protein n=1 Tax=Fibrella aquatilis TaxID=2817059 RepID=A0A939G933_9BACT|nr:DUF3857 domain-containing protein [Fibrella aquatilis]MBO0933245.1 DUF3857 domain-containing protein [Fibrella aquatilis]
MHTLLLRWLLCLAISGLLPSSTFATPTVAISPIPNWVLPVKPGGHNPPNKDITQGYFVSLFDTQVHVDKQASFTRLVREVRTSTGVQNASDILVYFDPNYQRLTLHEVAIIRQGKRINKLVAGAVKVEPSETERSSFIYNGTYVASLLLTDVRPNDQITYAYTLTGQNPIFGGRYSQTTYFGAGDPLPNRHHALFVDASRKLAFKTEHTSLKPTVTRQGNLLVYEWQAFDNKPTVMEDYTPAWFNTEPRIQVSEWTSWANVANWAAGLMAPPPLPPALRPLVDQWQKQAGGNPIRYARQAVAFVQDEIRYVGIELGENSHRPHPPEQVFRQRYGDCKDKSLLLCTLLAANGTQASVALTSSYLTHSMPAQLPDPNVFNHAIVCTQLGGKPVWIDPTMTNQRGNDADFYCPAYCHALLAKVGEQALRPIPVVGAGRIVMNETYRIPTSLVDSLAGQLAVHSTYTGRAANDMRSALAQQGKTSLEKSYLDYYQQSMSDQVVDTEAPLTDTDDPVRNLVVTQERYRLTNVWQADSGSTAKRFEIRCRGFVNELRSITARQRKTPLALAYPYEIDYTVRLHLPEVWTVENDSWAIDRPAYSCHFQKTHYPADSLVVLHFTYKNLRDHVALTDIATYRADIDKIDGDLALNLTQDPFAEPSTDINWLMVLVSVVTLAAGSYAGWQLYQHDRQPELLSSNPPLPIGGWLIVLAVALPLGASSWIWNLATDTSYYAIGTQTTLSQLGGTKGTIAVAMLYTEQITTCLFCLWSMLCMVLFFQRRTTFPRFFSLLLFVRFLFTLADTAVLNSLIKTDSTSTRELGSALVGVLIWVPYLNKSSRVKRTFLRLRDGSYWQPQAEAIPQESSVDDN